MLARILIMKPHQLVLYLIPLRIARRHLWQLRQPVYAMSLRPKKADIILDKHYILAAMGLLSQREPEIALQIMKEEIN